MKKCIYFHELQSDVEERASTHPLATNHDVDDNVESHEDENIVASYSVVSEVNDSNHLTEVIGDQTTTEAAARANLPRQ
jgi:hypothetical protein